MQILFRYVLCYNYVIILIQILIRYNVKNLITVCTRSLDFDLKIEKSPYPDGRGDPPPRPSLRSVASLPRICHFSTRCPPPPPKCVDPRYATVSYSMIRDKIKLSNIMANKTLTELSFSLDTISPVIIMRFQDDFQYGNHYSTILKMGFSKRWLRVNQWTTPKLFWSRLIKVMSTLTRSLSLGRCI